MSLRPYWIQEVKSQLARRSLVWLSGVRRVGKTTLCQSLGEISYFDCELPRVRTLLSEPEFFWSQQLSVSQKIVVLDEVHRLMDPAETLKIGTDHFPSLKIVATGSSTLAARKKFSDSLTGRKSEVWLTPVPCSQWNDFFDTPFDISRRVLNGGLPPFLLQSEPSDRDYTEWLDSYWGKDIQELFVVDKRAAFMTFFELILKQSGEVFEATAYASLCGVSRQTIQNYLSILETTHVVHALRPFNGGGVTEIKSQPKVFAFDTGFVCWAKSINQLNDDNKGNLLEHLVLNELQTYWSSHSIGYWRNKQKNEVDFILKPDRADVVHAIECKSQIRKHQGAGMNAFRRIYPRGKNVLVTFDALKPCTLLMDGLETIVTPVEQLRQVLME